MDCSTAVQLVLDQLIAPTVASEGTEGVRRLIRKHLSRSAINTLEITGIGLETGNPLMTFVGVLEQHLLVDLRTPTAIKLLTSMLDTITMRNEEAAPIAGPNDEKDPSERCHTLQEPIAGEENTAPFFDSTLPPILFFPSAHHDAPLTASVQRRRREIPLKL